MPLSADDLLDSPDERSQELGTVAAIYPELVLTSPVSATYSLPVSPDPPVPVLFGDAPDLHLISHFPPLDLTFSLPPTYPDSSPPVISISTSPPWLPPATLSRLQAELTALWSDLGHSPIIFTAIDHLTTAASTAFNLPSLPLPAPLQPPLLAFNTTTKTAIFNASTYTCPICLEPKKGTQCHRLLSCTHVFCLPCLKDYFTTMITEGHISSVICSSPSCHPPPSSTLPPTLPPSELQAIGLPPPLITRYITLKQKSVLETDPTTVYCPRQWCQSPSRESLTLLTVTMTAQNTSFYLPPYGTPLSSSSTPPSAPTPPVELQKLQICTRCTFAFCRVCTAGWHGDLTICRAKDAPLTAEEEANVQYLKEKTTQCPHCGCPVLKSMGCNHMVCRCLTHFCFLCSAYLPPGQPYAHFNTRGGSCYMRLWEGEDGDGEGEGVGMGVEGRGVEGGEVIVQEGERRQEEREVIAQAEERQEERGPFVVGVVAAPRVPRVAVVRPPVRMRVRGRFADWGETDEEDTEGEELGMDFDDVPDEP